MRSCGRFYYGFPSHAADCLSLAVVTSPFHSLRDFECNRLFSTVILVTFGDFAPASIATGSNTLRSKYLQAGPLEIDLACPDRPSRQQAEGVNGTVNAVRGRRANIKYMIRYGRRGKHVGDRVGAPQPGAGVRLQSEHVAKAVLV